MTSSTKRLTRASDPPTVSTPDSRSSHSARPNTAHYSVGSITGRASISSNSSHRLTTSPLTVVHPPSSGTKRPLHHPSLAIILKRPASSNIHPPVRPPRISHQTDTNIVIPPPRCTDSDDDDSILSDLSSAASAALSEEPRPSKPANQSKKRPKNASETPQPHSISEATSSTRPTTSLPKPLHPVKPSKVLRSIANSTTPATRNALANLSSNGYLASTARTGVQATAPFIVEDDSPLPKVPRIGMGEEYPPPQQSDIRLEAAYIIKEAAKRREADAKSAKRRARMRQREGLMEIDDGFGPGTNTPPPTGRHNGRGNSGDDYDEDGAGPSSYGDYNNIEYPYTPISGSRQPNPIELTVYDSYINDNKTFGQRPLQTDPRPPRFKKGQEETIVLAPNGSGRPKARDLVERMHEDGYEGLTSELESDAVGFVENVKSNLRTIIEYSFPQPSARRDAFIEKIGRGLADLGWRMTDASDAAF